MSEKIYDAFISYSHQDLKWGKWLQKRLENYRIPRGLRGKEGRGHLRVFRDQTDLAGVELHDSLQKALESARYLIVICSPASAASRWVNEEVLAFQRLGGGDRIIPFIVAGEPGSDRPEQECYPPALRNLEDRELLGANVQEIGRGKASLKVLSILLEVRFNRLADRDRKRRWIRGLTMGAAALAAAVIGVTVWARERAAAYDGYAATLLTKQREDFDEKDTALLERSAELGNVVAMRILADCCSRGYGGPVDEGKAFFWRKRAAEMGDTASMVELMNHYVNGVGTERNLAEGYAWARKVADSGNGEAMRIIGNMYMNGMGVEENEGEAFAWFQKAAEAGNAPGMFQLSVCYILGMGTEKNIPLGISWAEKAAAAGDTRAMVTLGTVYRLGDQIPEDPEKSFEWYRRAAASGEAEGLYRMGWCIENDYGMQNAARAWYEAAAEAGSEEAKEALERMGRQP